jgi:TM2 domain-containing membrane protein YozV
MWLFVGILGVHQFYPGKPGRGVLCLLTLGGLGIGPFIDRLALPAQMRRVNAGV